ncbi:hypothetical protein [Bifidobacterium mongoliense]|uniref:hypothetical protein n=1 Tax=Bifidobacterium mongoliense TaxID=518643 RepID=UPI0026478B07|nr:hypothetical protein [Bifidobacterium mongoliense]MDN6024709.1 hypothetical protein [Bifidobacterium mongoliense]MDN6719134.1 hypothetical protein [Bifidobacterium mongoliense]
MAFHPDITRKDDVTLAMDTANAAVRIASRQLTGNAGTVEIPNADGTSTIIGAGAGDTGVATWVGDTTAPGKPLGITAESHNGAVWVSWDGTLDGGVPADFDHVQFTAVDGSKKVDMGQLTAAGKVTAAELTAGDTVTITAIAYDNAHTADGSSAPNASEVSEPVTVVVQSAVDASVVQKAQEDAQSALDKAGKATDTATAAKTTADGKNKIFSANSEPSHAGLVPGDLWFQLDSSSHVTGIQVWNGSAFVDYRVVANEILVAGSVGTTQIKNGAITTDLLTSNAVTAIKIAAQTITGDKLNVGSVASAIITSGLFKTADSGARVTIDSTGIKAYDASGNVTFQVDSATGKATMVGGMATGVSGQNRAVVEYNNQNQQGQFTIVGSDDAPIFFIGGGQSSTSRYADLMVTNPNGVNPSISMSNTGAVAGETSIELNADEVSLNKHDLTSKRRCVFNWENSWTGTSDTGSGFLEGTFNFSMSRGWYLVEAYVRTNGTGKEYHLDLNAFRTNGTRMDTWAMNLPMPSRGIGNMVCSQMVYVDDNDGVDLNAKLYSRDYGSRPELFAGNDSKWSLYYPKRALSRYFRIFAM